ncbi:hypothetical protein A6C57_01390 [Fibrella sp. ES10-3-2-2]|nr:hypothetical protein A6C57_01390 [Fibrella sp. ES10-3-2-2]
MPDLDLTMSRQISAQIIAYLVGNLPIDDFATWVHKTPALRSLLSPADYDELMSIDFHQTTAPSLLDNLLRGYIDWAQYEKEQLSELLMAIIWKDNAPAALIQANELYTQGFTFLKVLGNDYGLAVRTAYGDAPSVKAEDDTLLLTLYPKAREEAKRLLTSLVDGRIAFTGTYTPDGTPEFTEL